MIHLCGCSLSSSFETKYNWSELLELPVTNYSAIAGSNQRSWRRLHDAIKNGATKCIMQITTVDRKEWWVPEESVKDQNHYVEKYKEYWVFKFKYGSHIDNPNSLLKKASKINYNFINEEWEYEDFIRQHQQFDAWCKSKGVEIFYISSDTYVNTESINSLNITDILETHCLPNDSWHLSEQGHKLVSERVKKYILKNFPTWYS